MGTMAITIKITPDKHVIDPAGVRSSCLVDELEKINILSHHAGEPEPSPVIVLTGEEWIHNHLLTGPLFDILSGKTHLVLTTLTRSLRNMTLPTVPPPRWAWHWRWEVART